MDDVFTYVEDPSADGGICIWYEASNYQEFGFHEHGIIFDRCDALSGMWFCHPVDQRLM